MAKLVYFKLSTQPSNQNEVTFIVNKSKNQFLHLHGLESENSIDSIHCFMCVSNVWQETDNVISVIKNADYIPPGKYNDTSVCLQFYENCRLTAIKKQAIQPVDDFSGGKKIEPRRLGNPNISHRDKVVPLGPANESSSEEELELISSRLNSRKKSKKVISSESEPEPMSKKNAKRALLVSESESEPEPTPKKKTKKVVVSSSESEPEVKPKKKSKKAIVSSESESEESEPEEPSESESEPELSILKKKKKGKQESSSESEAESSELDISSEDEPPKKKRGAPVKRGGNATRGGKGKRGRGRK